MSPRSPGEARGDPRKQGRLPSAETTKNRADVVAASARRITDQIQGLIDRDAPMLSILRSYVSSGIGRRSPRGTHVQALTQASQGQNPAFVIFIIVAVLLAVFWRPVLKIGIAAMIIGFLFLLVTGLLDVLHVLHALIP